MEKQVTLSEELAKQMIASGNEELKALALENYPNLQKSKYPMKWQDLGQDLSGFYIDSYNLISQINDNDSLLNSCENHNIYPTEELAKAAQVLPLLLQLRNAWWKADGWDMKASDRWASIYSGYDGLHIGEIGNTSRRTFSFKDQETAKLFLDTFRAELEIAKPLL